MRALCITLFALLCLGVTGKFPAMAQAPSLPTAEWEEREILISDLTNGDIRFIQDALMWNGTYSGFKDGVWGPMTQTALDLWRSRNNINKSDGISPREIAGLIGLAWARKDEIGWKVWRDPNSGVIHGYPSRYVSPKNPPTRSDFGLRTEYSGQSGVTMSTFELAPNSVKDIIPYLVDAFKAASVQYRLDRPNRKVLSATSSNDTRIFYRVDMHNGKWLGFLLVVRADSKVNFDLMATAASSDFSVDGVKWLPEPDRAPTIISVFRWVGSRKNEDKNSPSSPDARNDRARAGAGLSPPQGPTPPLEAVSER